MEQLVWAIAIIAFIIYTAIKNRARSKAYTNIDRTAETEHTAGGDDDQLSRYMEELLGIERHETRKQISVKEEKPKPLKKRVKQEPEREPEAQVGQFVSPLTKKFDKKQKSPLPVKGKRDICHTTFPWGALSKKDLPNAIILSEIIGPPISKRKSHRLF